MIRRAWQRHRALALMGRHERWRVAMGCPGVARNTPRSDYCTPIKGEVYCRCTRCHHARALVGWDPLA